MNNRLRWFLSEDNIKIFIVFKNNISNEIVLLNIL